MDKTKTIKYTLCGLDYVYVTVKVKNDGDDEVITSKMGDIEKEVVKQLICQHVPLRGREVRFLRKALKKSRNEWAKKLGMTASAILRWENKLDQHIGVTNEIALRILVCFDLGIDLPSTWEGLAQHANPTKIEVEAA